ncbi:hypothetical protein ACFW0K_001716 [Enterobacter hormaechei]|uniref:hypothetical protein n=1 Tax=Enterobacter TaxID=547 RepID=UPI000735B1C1|nr:MULTISPECIES: hypothetical protein [Enterobacter]EHF4951321.1 hypothetical protein [Enterobacter hormaechei]KTH61444.1 hypothetical protein ASV21_07240 [Enterobacter hormaechei subsp. steigerwaltii]KTJ48985.1 hypothetical protein ASU81_13050 [Enterobacter hormaechei subsp. steigerwaltii]KZP96293.1 hypothetical protein A3N35_10735 [Enterobacter hormaechei subsp. steigerwaltii]MBW7608638.1 hypothetical protein [Enterobacter hormaechei]
MTNTSNKVERGIITFFDFDKFGLYQILQGKPPKLMESNMDSVLVGLREWISSRSVLQSVPWGNQNNRRIKAFCKNLSYDKDTGDYLFVIWKTLGDSKGDIQGIEANSIIDETSDNVVSASETQDGKNYIWGLPCYYWVIPEYNKVASIRFPSSYADTDLFCQYIKAYVDYRFEDPSKIIHDIEIPRKGNPEPSKFKRVFFKKGKHSLTFKVLAKQTRKITKGANIAELCKKITHIVYHDVIETNVPDSRTEWQKLFDKFGGIFSNSSPVLSKRHKVELLVEGQPSPEEFERLIEEYLEDYDPVESSDDEVTDDDDTDADESSIEKQGKNQVRIGFKVNGKNGATTWLDEYVLRHEIYTSLGNRNKHYSSSYLLGIVKSHRNDLITYLKEDNLKETEELSYTEADNDGEGNVTGLGA